MSTQWYYVKDGERRGPVEESKISELVNTGELAQTDYIWRKGYDNWKTVSDSEEFKASEMPNLPDPIGNQSQRISDLAGDGNSIFIKIGLDRGAREVEYGPYSLELLRKLFEQNRVNAKTFIFIKGMDDWKLLADFEDYSEIFAHVPPPIAETERRANKRKPFVARMFIENNQNVYLGICRDISVGGMQVLVDHFPFRVGESIAINVHPENSDYHFVASGEIVRALDGGQGFSFRFQGLSGDAKDAIERYLTRDEEYI
jgi:hypothetical protein